VSPGNGSNVLSDHDNVTISEQVLSVVSLLSYSSVCYDDAARGNCISNVAGRYCFSRWLCSAEISSEASQFPLARFKISKIRFHEECFCACARQLSF